MTKINRSAFLYLTGKKDDFAQCSSCCFTEPRTATIGRCTILGLDVADDDTCGLYVPGGYSATSDRARVPAKEAGLLRHTQVRCENCKYGGSKCRLYVALNKAAPHIFDLEEKITPESCCNAWTAK